ncbi:flagellar basal body-associated FliL family protein [Rhizobium halophytocola]|uniref:Flagellar protein FliL n=1 Tax=Rhizobium halophytocola TaxID=735519 RepID=A0ABS4E5D4_9HYPH|nr:flagellar basal body-associated FliL family protein [Rhizobium halophytocola]MBP1853123.1 flagellar FliL protein [Rhizobium halophytocola]
MDDQSEDQPKKKSPLVVMLISLAVLTIVGGGGGWLVGGMIAPAVKSAKEEAAKAEEAKAKPEGEGEKKGEEAGLPHVATEANGIVQLEPITTNLAYPSDNWVRLEVALLFNGKPDVAMAEDISQDIIAYMRTVSLQQVDGPRGLQYLKDDIQERVDLRSEGRVTKVMFRTFVIQ